MEKWQDPETLALWFGIILTFVIILVVSIISLVRIGYLKILKKTQEENELKINHQRELLETNIAVQERERERIAADLHDELIGKLTAIKLTNQVNTNNAALDPMLHESIKIARRITHDLSPPLIEMTSLDELFEELLAPWKNTFNIHFIKDIRTQFNLKSTYKIQLKRVAQEIITNTEKHADANKIEIVLRHTENLLALRICDNGKGIDIEKDKKGLGLKNIESRIQFMRGKYKVKSQKGKGTSFLFIFEKPNT